VVLISGQFKSYSVTCKINGPEAQEKRQHFNASFYLLLIQWKNINYKYFKTKYSGKYLTTEGGSNWQI
jgi:coenzyme F420-reducing hydrogenase alpha subunit